MCHFSFLPLYLLPLLLSTSPPSFPSTFEGQGLCLRYSILDRPKRGSVCQVHQGCLHSWPHRDKHTPYLPSGLDVAVYSSQLTALLLLYGCLLTASLIDLHKWHLTTLANLHFCFTQSLLHRKNSLNFQHVIQLFTLKHYLVTTVK